MDWVAIPFKVMVIYLLGFLNYNYYDNVEAAVVDNYFPNAQSVLYNIAQRQPPQHTSRLIDCSVGGKSIYKMLSS